MLAVKSVAWACLISLERFRKPRKREKEKVRRREREREREKEKEKEKKMKYPKSVHDTDLRSRMKRLAPVEGKSEKETLFFVPVRYAFTGRNLISSPVWPK